MEVLDRASMIFLRMVLSTRFYSWRSVIAEFWTWRSSTSNGTVALMGYGIYLSERLRRRRCWGICVDMKCC